MPTTVDSCNSRLSAAPTAFLADTPTLGELLDFEAPYVLERLLKRGIVKDREEYEHLFAEMKKYLWLTANYASGLSMFSLRVDEIWHQFILFTKQYHDFCERFFGRYMHHLPESSYIPRQHTSRQDFERLYEMHFGAISGVWREDTFGDTCGPTGACRG